ncbi:hypothetical protein ANN_02562 [Periplaneta americana]|uniref:CHK kinase-like domain-containing protein n=1 Tax=Periplaneta americana TaxID=6978 RepID=A0ABQ8TWM9_PERAM|nr:hypothetical protein ANN_02562 [Periplaneta americana]
MQDINQQDLQSLLRPQLGNDVIVESFTSKPLTQPGENYGSTMLALEVNIIKGDDKATRRKLDLVAKLVFPPGFLWKIFDPPNTAWKEILCYISVKEEYEKLQKEKCVPKEKFLDVFPRCYGARTTLSKEIGEKADENAVLLLENLKTLNYRLGDRKKGLDLTHTRLAVSQLARFHAMSIALKNLKPQVFKGTVLRACRPHNFDIDEEEMRANTPKLLNSVKIVPECEMYVDRVLQAINMGIQRQFGKSLLPPCELYATIVHSDFWVNNMMFMYDPNNENSPVGIKFVDFQIIIYSSCVRDLIFFLYTSTEEGVIRNHYDELIHLYHDNFTDCLKVTGCDTSAYTFQSLLDEIDAYAPVEAHHILFMLTPICADTNDVPQSLSEIDGFTSEFLQPNAAQKRKTKEFIIDFVKRGWI